MKRSKTGCDLKSCMFCRLCMSEWIPAIDANRKTFTVKKGRTIFIEGQPVDGMYFVVDGVIKVHKRWGTDKELIVRFAKKGSIVGHRGLGEDGIYPVSGTAIEQSTVCFIDLSFFRASLKINHEFLFELMMFFAEELKTSERKMRDMVHMSVKGRIANALLALKQKFGLTEKGFIDITLSRQDLASYAGTTYETVFRVLSEFTEDNIIKNADKDIAIVDEQLLTKIAVQGNEEQVQRTVNK